MKDEEKPPLRVVLRNFLNHIESLESQVSPDKSYDIEFQALKLFSENVKGLKEYSCLEGEKEVNRKKNRYKDILPFDVSRVVLQEYNGIPGSDYINANFIKGASGSPAYIASQGPLPCTVNDFWRMVVQCEVHVIVMACNQEEAGKAKCEKYWVDEGEERHFGRISVRLLKSSTVCPDFSVRTMRLKYSNSSMVSEERTVCQVHYVAWPDHGVPSVVHPLLDMVRLVRDTQASETLPVLVHCSAGCGRTGTICAIDYVFGLLRTGKLTSDFSLSALIRDMRRQRIAMVQTKEQYVLVHQAVRELFREQLSVIDSHPYENVDPDGSLIIKTDQANIYDTIECPEEKGDFKMEKDAQIGLYPKKKHVTLYSSKQEKEVENLTEQLRSVQAGSNPRAVVDIIGDVTSHSNNNQHLGNRPLYKQDFLGKKENLINKPIPSKGILRVPLLPSSCGSSQSTGPSTIVPVKRSKSLKIMSPHRDRSLGPRLTIPPEPQLRVTTQQIHPILSTSVQIKRRSSLELANGTTDPASSINEPRLVAEEASVLSKYDAIQKKPLVRSYTTLDMRHKLTMALSERRIQQALSVDIRPGMSSYKTPPEKAFERSYGETNNTRRGTNRSYVFRNIGPPPPSTSQPPARAYMVRERSNKNFIAQKSSHSSGVAEFRAVPKHQTVRQYQHSDSYHHHHQQQQHHQPHHRTYLQPVHQSNSQGPYVDKIKISRPSRALGTSAKDSEVKYESSVEYRGLTSDTAQPQHPSAFDHRAPLPPTQGPSMVGPNSPLYPPLPPRNQHPLVPLPLVPRDTQIQNTNFAMAPGVDIDQVAASIPHKDESKSNLMKVALEPFQSRKVKQQGRPPPQRNLAAKGPLPNYSGCKKKQQQYL